MARKPPVWRDARARELALATCIMCLHMLALSWSTDGSTDLHGDAAFTVADAGKRTFLFYELSRVWTLPTL